MAKKADILLGMSGGLDSSLAAYLLQKASYRVHGVSFRLADRYVSGKGKQSNVVEEAAKVCRYLGIDHSVVDYREKFESCVVSYFSDAYFRGLTPNPCVQCNLDIKWPALRDFADTHGIPSIATGHYARIEKEAERMLLLRGKDRDKDQSYFLWRLSQEDLAKTLFPLGELLKSEVAAIAKDIGLQQATQAESQDLCFIAEGDYTSFLEKYYPEKIREIDKGTFIDMQGRPIAEHDGYYRFTIGQRKGLGIARGEPLYVRAIYPESNSVQLGNRRDSESMSCLVSDCNWISFSQAPQAFDCSVKIRYRGKAVKARVEKESNGLYRVLFEEAVHAITPGQSAVFYDGEILIGGAIIQGKSREVN